MTSVYIKPGTLYLTSNAEAYYGSLMEHTTSDDEEFLDRYNVDGWSRRISSDHPDGFAYRNGDITIEALTDDDGLVGYSVVRDEVSSPDAGGWDIDFTTEVWARKLGVEVGQVNSTLALFMAIEGNEYNVMIGGKYHFLKEIPANISPDSFWSRYDFWENATPEDVALCLKAGADIEQRNIQGLQPLERAVHWSTPEVAKALLEAGADINAIGDGGCRPLHIAVSNGNLAMVNILLGHEANPNGKDNYGRSPLFDAVVSDKTDIGLALLDAGGDANTTMDITSLLHIAVALGSAPMVQALLAAGADVNAADKDGNTSLHKAVFRQSPDMLNILLGDAKADVNACTKAGESVLFMATWWGNVEGMKALLARGADVTVASTPDGYTALHAAGQRGTPEQAAILLNAGADATIPDKDGNTPVTISADNRPTQKVLIAARSARNASEMGLG